jgi:hypothetical protein
VFVSLLSRICTVPVNEYRNGERRELDLPLEKVSKGRLRFAITVNYTHRPQVAQEPPRNNSGREVWGHFSKF